MKLQSKTPTNIEDPLKRNYKDFANMIIQENANSKLKNLRLETKNIPKAKKGPFKTPAQSPRISTRA